MPGLFTAAIAVSLLRILVCGTLILQIAVKRDYPLLVLLFLLALPPSAGTYYVVHLPLKGQLKRGSTRIPPPMLKNT